MAIDLRINVNLPAKYTFKDSTYECEITNLSENDLTITAKQVFYLGDVMKIAVELDETPIEIISEVKKLNTNSSVFMEIIEMRPNDRDFLEQYVLDTYKSQKIRSKNPFK